MTAVVSQLCPVEYNLKKVDFMKRSDNRPFWIPCRTTIMLSLRNMYNLTFTRHFIRVSSTLKGTHTVYFSSSLYIINQKPMIPKTHFHCITTWVAHSSGWNSAMHFKICLFCGFGLLARWRYYSI